MTYSELVNEIDVRRKCYIEPMYEYLQKNICETNTDYEDDYLQTGMESQMLELASKAADENVQLIGDADSLHNLAVEYVRKGFSDAACMFLEKGLQMRKMEGNIDLLADYIKYADAAGGNTLDKAQIYYEKLCSISWKRWNWRAYEFSIDYLLSSLNIEFEKRESDEVIYQKIMKHANDYRKQFEEHPKRDRAYYTLANVYSSRNEHKKMLNLLTKALQDGRKMPLCAMKLAEYYFKMGDYEKTTEYIELCKVMEIDMEQDMKFGYPYLISALCMMVEVYKELGTWKRKGDQEKRDIIALITENYDVAIIALGDKDSHIKEVKKQLDVLKRSLGVQNQIYLEE